jgi:hypothetical protein
MTKELPPKKRRVNHKENIKFLNVFEGYQIIRKGKELLKTHLT